IPSSSLLRRLSSSKAVKIEPTKPQNADEFYKGFIGDDDDNVNGDERRGSSSLSNVIIKEEKKEPIVRLTTFPSPISPFTTSYRDIDTNSNSTTQQLTP